MESGSLGSKHCHSHRRGGVMGVCPLEIFQAPSLNSQLSLTKEKKAVSIFLVIVPRGHIGKNLQVVYLPTCSQRTQCPPAFLFSHQGTRLLFLNVTVLIFNTVK